MAEEATGSFSTLHGMVRRPYTFQKAASFTDLEKIGASLTVLHENLNAHVRVFLKELTNGLIGVINVKSTPRRKPFLIKNNLKALVIDF